MERTKTYFVADIHLGLKANDPAGREERFVRWLRSIRTPETRTLWLLGDIWDFWYEYRDVVPREGARVLSELIQMVSDGIEVYFVPGNHDLWWVSTNKLNTLFDDVAFLQNHAYMVTSEIAICGTRGWICPGTQGFDDHDNKIYERELLRLRMSLDDARAKGAKEIIGCTHYPPMNDKFQTSGFTQLMQEYKVSQCIYGHLHGREAFKNGFQGLLNGTRYRLVSLDYVKCEPQLVKEI